VIAAKGTRSTGRHFVKWTGPNADASLMVASRACPLLVQSNTRHNLLSSSPSASPVAVEASAATPTSIPIVAVGKSESPIGFHLLHTPRSAFQAIASTAALAARSDPPPAAAADLGLHVLMLLEPGSIIWSCGMQPDRHTLLQELTSIVTIAQLVAATNRRAACMFPNHLVIAPHGWPSDASKKAEQELYDWLFKFEATVSNNISHMPSASSSAASSVDLDAVARNEMRLIIESAFLSVQVFAFPDPETLQFRDRIDQCFRSRWVAGCFEGWGVPAAPPLSNSSKSGSAGDDLDSTASTHMPRFPPIIFADSSQKLSRVQRVLNLCHSPSTLSAPFASSSQMDQWLKERLQGTIDADFAQHCAARKSRMTSQQAWEVHDHVLARCRQLAELDLVSSPDVKLELSKTSEASLDASLQHVLVIVQEAEEERRKLQQQRQQAAAQQQDRRGVFGGDGSESHDRELWLAEHVQRWVPRRYWFWFTTQGLGVLFVFTSLLLYTFWPRKS
jgi:hypothetical protein